MADMEDNPAYGHVERTETYTESSVYELPEILPSKPKKQKSSWSPREVKIKNESERCHSFNIFITVFAVVTFMLILTFLIFFLVTYSANQPLEAQQNTDIEAIISRFNISNQEVMNQRKELDKAKVFIQTLQEQQNQSQEQIEALQDYAENLERQLNTTNHDIKFQSSDLQEQIEFLKVVCGFRMIADIDMTDPTQQCPDGFKLINRTEPPLRTCGRPDGFEGCVSTMFPVHGIRYSYVSGRIVGYQIGSPSGIGTYLLSSSINSTYVAGISLTHGQPRQHIWTFVNARGEGYTTEVCPCVSGSTESVPQFVGNDYFCDSAVRGSNASDGVFYPNDPLWDGQGCGSTSTCCEFNNPPWFYKQLPQSTTDDIELRLCENSQPFFDDSPFKIVELYIN